MTRLSVLERCNQWLHVGNRHMSTSQLIVKLLLLIYSFQFRSAFPATTTPSQPRPLPSQTHYRHRHIPELICEVNSSINSMHEIQRIYSVCYAHISEKYAILITEMYWQLPPETLCYLLGNLQFIFAVSRHNGSSGVVLLFLNR